MGSILDKPMVLERIKQLYALKSNAELARFLGVAPNTITNWYGRKTFDLDIIYTKCVKADFNWLFTGEGSMLRDELQIQSKSLQPAVQQELAGEAAAYYKLFEKKDAEVGVLKEQIGALKNKLSQYEPITEDSKKHPKGLDPAKNASTKKPSSQDADNATSATAR